MAAVAGYNGAIYITSNASSVSMTNEAMTDSGDHITYTVTNAAHRYWDDTAVPVVQTSPDGSTWTTQSTSTYTVQYVGGKIIWNVAKASGTQVRITSGSKYYAYSTFAYGTSWEFDPSSDMLETSTIGGGRGKSFIPGQVGGKFTLKSFWIDNSFLNNIQTGFRLIFSGSTDAVHRYEGYAYTSSSKLSMAVNTTVNEDLDFQITGGMYYN